MTEGRRHQHHSQALALASCLLLAPPAWAEAKGGVVIYVTPAQSYLILSAGADKDLTDRSDLCFYAGEQDKVPRVCGIVNVVGKAEAVVITYAGRIASPKDVSVYKPATPDAVAELRKLNREPAPVDPTKKKGKAGKGGKKNPAETIIFIAKDKSYFVVNAGKALQYERGATVCVDGPEEQPGACGTVSTSREQLAVVGTLSGAEETLVLGKHVSVTETAPDDTPPQEEADAAPPPPPAKPMPPPPALPATPPPPPPAPPPAPKPADVPPAPRVVEGPKKPPLTLWVGAAYTLLAKSTFNAANFIPYGQTEMSRSTMWQRGKEGGAPNVGPTFVVEQRFSRSRKWQVGLRYQFRPKAIGKGTYDDSDPSKVVDTVYKGSAVGGFAAYGLKMFSPAPRSPEGLWLNFGLDLERSFLSYGAQIDAYVPARSRTELASVSSQLDVLSLRTAVNYEVHLWYIGIQPELALSLPFTQLNKHETDDVYPPVIVPYSGAAGPELNAKINHRRSKIGLDLILYFNLLPR